LVTRFSGAPPSRRLARRRPAAVESETLSGQPARTPALRNGVDGIYPVRYAESNDSYVFGYRLMLSSLFLVRGLR